MTRPQSTMMIQARTPERTLELVQKGLEGKTDAFGWQLEQLEICYHTEEVFRRVLSAMGDKPCYVTNYRDHLNEGRDAHTLADELVTAARCGASLIDIMGDMFCPTRYQITEDAAAVAEQQKLIDRIHAEGARVLISSHTYCYLPACEVIRIAQLQRAHGADVIKIVTAADNEVELMHNFEITAKLKETLDREFLFLCVGQCCHTHRRLGPMMAGGMFLCVAEHDELATPAQPLLADARTLIDTVFSI